MNRPWQRFSNENRENPVPVRMSFVVAREEKQILRSAQDDMSF
jgi:hypothetical protein